MSALRSILELPLSTSLPADPDDAELAVVALIEQSTLDLDAYDDVIVKCGGRFFYVVWGAGRDVVEVDQAACLAMADNALLDDFLAQRRDAFADAIDASVEDALSIEFYMEAARLQAAGLSVRPGVSAGFQRLAFGFCLVILLAIAITIVGALADDGMERCQQTASFDTCFTALNR